MALCYIHYIPDMYPLCVWYTDRQAHTSLFVALCVFVPSCVFLCASWHSTQGPCRCLDLHKSSLVLSQLRPRHEVRPLPPLHSSRTLPPTVSSLQAMLRQERKRCQPQVSGIRSALCQQTSESVRGKKKCTQTGVKDIR